MADEFRSRRLHVRAVSVGGTYGGTSILWVLAAAAAVLYGSLIPFQFDWSSFDATMALGRLHIGLGKAGFEDIITNVLVYVPLGLAVAFCGAPIAGGAGWRWLRLCAAVLLGTGVSVLAEALQTGIAIRVPSWLDVVLNALGSAVGAAIGLGLRGPVGHLSASVQQRWGERPFGMIAPALMVGLLGYGLLPFDFVTSTEGLHAAFQRARLDLFALRSPPVGQPPFGAITDQLIDFAWFLGLGYVLFRAARERAWGRGTAGLAAVKSGFILVLVVEWMQLFTASHVFDIAAIVLRCVAVLFGNWCGSFFEIGARPTRHDGMPVTAYGDVPSFRLLLRCLLVAFGVFQITMLVLADLDPARTAVSNFALDRIRWLPMETLWHRPFGLAVAESVRIVVTFGVLALTCALLLGRGRRIGIWLVAGTVTLLIAALVEVLQGCTPGRTPDLTGPALALLAVVIAFRLSVAFTPARSLN